MFTLFFSLLYFFILGFCLFCFVYLLSNSCFSYENGRSHDMLIGVVTGKQKIIAADVINRRALEDIGNLVNVRAVEG